VQRLLGVLLGLSLFIPLARYQTGLVDRVTVALDSVTSPADKVDAPVPQLGRVIDELRVLTSK
jgi:hypothetical protein